MEPHTSQNVFQKGKLKFLFFDYRRNNEEAPFLETQPTWKKKVLEEKTHIIILCSRNKLLNSAHA